MVIAHAFYPELVRFLRLNNRVQRRHRQENLAEKTENFAFQDWHEVFAVDVSGVEVTSLQIQA